MKKTFEIVDAGFFTTVQDAGRFGHRKYGVPVGGVMDSYAQKLANWLVGNPFENPVLEITLQGGTYRFHHSTSIAVTGASAEIELNGKSAPQFKTILVEGGDVLRIGKASAGCRIYLAVQGAWNIEEILGSRSTYVPAGFGGIEGRTVQKGDLIECNAVPDSLEVKTVPGELKPYFGSTFQIRVMEGPEWSWLDDRQQQVFLEKRYQVRPDSNRMGIRLKSDQPVHPEKREMISSPVVPGIIQLPSNGQPIILMKDAQSVGGYPRVAKVIDADLWRLGQVWPPSEIHFKMVDREEAIKLSAFQKKLLY